MKSHVEPCSVCGGPRDRSGQAYCRACHAAYMREWRKTHPLVGPARKRDIARSYARVYKRRGKLIPQPCECCGSLDVVMHHHDYDKPLEVTWVCRRRHREIHRRERTAA